MTIPTIGSVPDSVRVRRRRSSCGVSAILAALVGLAVWEMSVLPALLVVATTLVLTVVLEIRLLPVSAMKEEP